MEAVIKQSDVNAIITDDLVGFLKESKEVLEAMYLSDGVEAADRFIQGKMIDYEIFLELAELVDRWNQCAPDNAYQELTGLVNGTTLEHKLRSEVMELDDDYVKFDGNTFAEGFVNRVAEVWQELKDRI